MSNRIPALRTLALLTTAACAPDPVPGDWVVTHFLNYEGVTLELPYTVDYNAQTYRTEMFVWVDRAGFGFFDLYTHISENGTFAAAYTYSYALTADRISKGNWFLAIPTYYRLELDCAADRDSMNCVGTDADGYAYDMDLVPY